MCSWQLTPRTADLLHTALIILADQAYDDAQRLGDQFLPDADSTTWEVFDRLPPLTRTADHRWRRRMARAFDDLASDLVRGKWPEHATARDAGGVVRERVAGAGPPALTGRPEQDQHAPGHPADQDRRAQDPQLNSF